MKTYIILLFALAGSALFGSASDTFESRLELYRNAVQAKDFTKICEQHRHMRSFSKERAFEISAHDTALHELIASAQPETPEAKKPWLKLFAPDLTITHSIRCGDWDALGGEKQHIVIDPTKKRSAATITLQCDDGEVEIDRSLCGQSDLLTSLFTEFPEEGNKVIPLSDFSVLEIDALKAVLSARTKTASANTLTDLVKPTAAKLSDANLLNLFQAADYILLKDKATIEALAKICAPAFARRHIEMQNYSAEYVPNVVPEFEKALYPDIARNLHIFEDYNALQIVDSPYRHLLFELNIPNIDNLLFKRRAYSQFSGTYDYAGQINSVAFSPGGKWVASGSADRRLCFWNAQTGKKIESLTFPCAIKTVAYSAKGSIFAVALADGSVKLHNQIVQSIITLSQGKPYANSIAFSPDGNTLATGSPDNSIRLWNTDSGLEEKALYGHQDAIRCLAFSPDGKLIASGSDDETVRVWDMQTGSAIAMGSSFRTKINSVAFSPSGKLAYATAGVVRIWRIKPQERTLLSLDRCVKGDKIIGFSADDKMLITGLSNGTICFWDMQNGALLSSLEIPDPDKSRREYNLRLARITESQNSSSQELFTDKYSCAISLNGRSMVTTSGYGRIHFWERYLQKLSQIIDPEERFFLLSAARDWQNGRAHFVRPEKKKLYNSLSDRHPYLIDKRLFVLSETDPTRMLDELKQLNEDLIQTTSTLELCALTINNALIHKLTIHKALGIKSVAYSSDGKRLMWAGKYRNVGVINNDMSHTHVYEKNQFDTIAFSQDGQYGAGTDFLKIYVWDQKTGAKKFSMYHATHPEEITFSPNGKILTLRSASGKNVEIYDITLRKFITSFRGHTDWITSMAFNPEGTILATGSDDRTIRLWNVQTGRTIKVLKGHAANVLSVAFSPDGKTIVSGSTDKTVRLWDVASGTEIKTLSGHLDIVKSAAFSPDGTLIASGSDDSTVRLWRVDTGEVIDVLRGHTKAINSIAFDPINGTITSASDDKTIRTWYNYAKELCTISDPGDYMFLLKAAQDWMQGNVHTVAPEDKERFFLLTRRFPFLCNDKLFTRPGSAFGCIVS